MFGTVVQVCATHYLQSRRKCTINSIDLEGGQTINSKFLAGGIALATIVGIVALQVSRSPDDESQIDPSFPSSISAPETLDMQIESSDQLPVDLVAPDLSISPFSEDATQEVASDSVVRFNPRDELLASEPVDADWAARMAPVLESVVLTLNGRIEGVEGTECRSTVCRTVVRHSVYDGLTSEEEIRDLFLPMMREFDRQTRPVLAGSTRLNASAVNQQIMPNGQYVTAFYLYSREALDPEIVEQQRQIIIERMNQR